MGSGVWFKNIITLKKAKDGRSRKSKVQGSSALEKSVGDTGENSSHKETPNLANGASLKSQGVVVMSIEDKAASRIQTAFRAYKARKSFRSLKGLSRLQALTQGNSVKKQASTTLNYLHSWSRTQGEIKARRICMVTEGRLKQKKLENQLKLEAKLQGLDLDWSGGPETMEEVVAKIHYREEAAVRRERALAYAFSHQWRANSNPPFGSSNSDLGKANWGWSWMDRWIAARPWERRVAIQPSPKKTNIRQGSKSKKNTNSPTAKKLGIVKSISPNGKSTSKPRKLSYEAAENGSSQNEDGKPKEANAKKELTTS